MATPNRARSKTRPKPPPLPGRETPAEGLLWGFWLGIGLGVVLFSALGFGVLYFALADDKPDDSSSVAEETRESPKQTQSSDSLDAEFLSPQEKARREAVEKTQKKSQVKLVAPPPMEVVKNHIPTPMPNSEIKGPWDGSLRTLNGSLSLPVRKPSLIPSVQENAKAAMLAEIHVDDPNEIDLIILSPNGRSKEIGADGSKLEGFILEPPEDSADDDQTRKWIVKRQSFLMFNPVPQEYEVGTFALSDQKLTFEWNMQANLNVSKSLSLPYCLLEISRGNESHLFQLSEPKAVQPLSYDASFHEQKLFLDVNSSAVDEPQALRLELHLQGGDFEPAARTALNVGESLTLRTKDGGIEIELQFRCEQRGPYLEANALTTRPALVDVNSQPPRELQTLSAIQRERIDQIAVRSLRLPTVVADFDRLPRRGEALRKSLDQSNTFLTAQRDLVKVQRLIEKETDALKQQALMAQQRQFLDIIGKYRERIEAAAGYAQWCREMRPRFEKLAKSAWIGYSVYITINGEKVYLARTSSDKSLPSSNGIGN